MRAALSTRAWDSIRCDWSMPRFSGPAALRLMKERGLDVPFVFISGTLGEEGAVAAMRAGAHDYMLQDKLSRRLPMVVEREVREKGASGPSCSGGAPRRTASSSSPSTCSASRASTATSSA